MADLWQIDPNRAWTIAAGIAGALVPLAYQKGLTKREVVIQPLVALASTLFVTPFICQHFGMMEPEALLATGFFVSMTSYKALQWLLTGDTIARLLSNRTGG